MTTSQIIGPLFPDEESERDLRKESIDGHVIALFVAIDVIAQELERHGITKSRDEIITDAVKHAPSEYRSIIERRLRRDRW